VQHDVLTEAVLGDIIFVVGKRGVKVKGRRVLDLVMKHPSWPKGFQPVIHGSSKPPLVPAAGPSAPQRTPQLAAGHGVSEPMLPMVPSAVSSAPQLIPQLAAGPSVLSHAPELSLEDEEEAAFLAALGMALGPVRTAAKHWAHAQHTCSHALTHMHCCCCRMTSCH
jgi:hypothetical protein